MNTYRLQILAHVPYGWNRDDLHAQVVSNVSALTLVDSTRLDSLVRGGIQQVTVVFQGLNDNEARETVRRSRSGLPVSADALLDREVGSKVYVRVGPLLNPQACLG